jgi:hypothetical protein
MEWAEHEARMGERRVAYDVLVGRPYEKMSLGRPKHRWEDNIKMGIQVVHGGGGLD